MYESADTMILLRNRENRDGIRNNHSMNWKSLIYSILNIYLYEISSVLVSLPLLLSKPSVFYTFRYLSLFLNFYIFSMVLYQTRYVKNSISVLLSIEMVEIHDGSRKGFHME